MDFDRYSDGNSTFDVSSGTYHGELKGVLDGEALSVVEWLSSMFPELNLPVEPSEEELRACLIDGTVLCSILEKLNLCLVEMGGKSEPGRANVERFLASMDELGLPRFVLADIQQGYMGPVLRCLGTLRAYFDPNSRKEDTDSHSRKWSQFELPFSGTNHSFGKPSTDGCGSTADVEEKERSYINANSQHDLNCSVRPDANVVEFIKSNGLDNASTQTLFKLLNSVLDEGLEKKNGRVNHMIPLLKKIVQVIEQRTSIQAENLKEQNLRYQESMEKYESKVRVLETLAFGTTEEIEVLLSKLHRIKIEKAEIEEKEKLEKQTLLRLKEEKVHSESENLKLREELELAKMTNEENCIRLKKQADETTTQLNKKLQELECFLTKSRKKVKELESFSVSKSKGWKRKEGAYQSFIGYQSSALQNLRATSASIKHEILKVKRSYSEELNSLGKNLKLLAEAAGKYHSVLSENRRLYNEVQDLRGNIRVYCRVRPFLPNQCATQSSIEYIGENGELVVANPSKQGKNTHRLFKFNKVFGPKASQEEVFLDTQPLIRSVLDGYNVCIFAYGQTGSGKTYTMSGPSISREEDWGVNYRALHDLFRISLSRGSSITYEVGVQMVEIYNEQVRDLLTDTSSRKRLGIWNTTQPNGLTVPEASMYSVTSTADVLELMEIGLMNRAVGATALNERSSRSHSVLTVHVRGTDLETGGDLRGCLHLIDLAGSERVDRTEVTGDRLKEAQHINKSLSALGDVIFALAQKNSHVPYRNSKLTQLLQGSLGGQAKALMFVQLNPDVESYSETISTLKFAERVSGVELGAARSNKESRDIRELMDQITSLKNVIAKKDEEIEQLHSSKGNINVPNNSENTFCSNSSSPRRHSIGMRPQSPRLTRNKSSRVRNKSASDNGNSSDSSEKLSEAGTSLSMDDLRQLEQPPSHWKLMTVKNHHREFHSNVKSVREGVGQNSSKIIEAGTLPSADDVRQPEQPESQSKLTTDENPHKESLSTSKPIGADVGQNSTKLIEFLGLEETDSEERLSDISDVLSKGTRNYAAAEEPPTTADAAESSGAVKPTHARKPVGIKPIEVKKPAEAPKAMTKAEQTREPLNSPTKPPKPHLKMQQTRLSSTKGPGTTAKAKPSTPLPRKTVACNSPATKPVKRWH